MTMDVDDQLEQVAAKPSGIFDLDSLIRLIGRSPFFVSSLGFFLAMILVFAIVNPRVFLSAGIYRSVFTVLPLLLIVTVPLVFVVTTAEIDLSFPSVMGLGGLTFATLVELGMDPWVGFGAALAMGLLAGLLNGLLVTLIGLSSLVATLGMNFLLRGLIQIARQGHGIPLTHLRGEPFHRLFVGNLGGFPVQMLWAAVLSAVALVLFARHRFGAYVCCVGDNLEAAREMGIPVGWTKTAAFMYVGIMSALAGVMASLVNVTFWPTTGEGFLLLALAAVFLGGTPTWGGVGTVAGAIVGAFTVGFIETGIIAIGLTGFYTQFFFGLVIVLSLVGHRFARRLA